MKNKKFTYILLLLVSIIWALIFSKIFNYSSNRDVRRSEINPVKTKVEKQIQFDTTRLIANYPDPFLARNNVTYEKPSGIISVQTVKTSFKPTKDTLSWPTIKYNGAIKNKSSGKILGLINIRNKEFLAAEKDVLSDVEILKLYHDSVIVKFHDKKKTIRQ